MPVHRLTIVFLGHGPLVVFSLSPINHRPNLFQINFDLVVLDSLGVFLLPIRDPTLELVSTHLDDKRSGRACVPDPRPTLAALFTE